MFLFVLTYGQTEVYMTNGGSSACDGILYDSEAGNQAGHYDHDEDYIFTICVEGASSITLTFDSFYTERFEDYLSIYDGADTNATRLANRLNGRLSVSPINSSDSCITFYFHSDASVSHDGFKIRWETNTDPITSPQFNEPLDLSCNDAIIGFRLDNSIPCDSIADSNFSIWGASSNTISGVTPVNCSNGMTDTFTVSLSSGISEGGIYSLAYQMYLYDACDSAWLVSDTTTFHITDCPIEVELSLQDDTVCAGSCTDLEADVTGGDSTSYNYVWTQGISGLNGPHSVCPTTNTWYRLTVSDQYGNTDTDSILLTVIPIPSAMNDTTVCDGAGPLGLRATPAGGLWSGSGVSLDSFYGNVSGTGTFNVRYTIGQCYDSVQVEVVEVDAGSPIAACPNTPAFQLPGGTPAGGTWSGTNTLSDGTFNPIDTGTFTITYTWNECSDTKVVRVYDIYMKPLDTTCLSTQVIDLVKTPQGGVLSGPGILGDQRFHPPSAGAGTHTIYYSAYGCQDTAMVHVVNIDARYNQVFCPDAGPRVVVAARPPGGYYTGVGITDSLTGDYDPSFVYGINRTWYNDTIRYHYSGCTDYKLVYVRKTRILDDSAHFCPSDNRLLLNWQGVRRTPGGGQWTGTGTTGNYFDPQLAGPGIHEIKYTANGCMDSMIMQVRQPTVLQPDTFYCITDLPQTLVAYTSGGHWFGPGITDTTAGTFDPGTAGVGFHEVYFRSKFGCFDTLQVEVRALPIVNLSGLSPFYCFASQEVSVQGSPPGGTYYGTGLIDSSFNPVRSGTGSHWIYYDYGSPTCFSTDSFLLEVGDTLFAELSGTDTVICRGEDVILTAKGIRGNSTVYTFTWEDGSRNRSRIESPTANTSYSVMIEDGCSDPAYDTLVVSVEPSVHADVITSDTLCYGEMGFAEITPKPMDTYTITWGSSPSVNGSRLDAEVGINYPVSVVSNTTGCRLDSFVLIPGYEKIVADFILVPQEGRCINVFRPDVDFINMSRGGTLGEWRFGDGNGITYDQFINPTHRYTDDTSYYEVSLVVRNEAGCADSTTKYVCFEDSVYVIVPTAFSPNGDGVNDEFGIFGSGLNEIDLRIYNRWGEMVFQTNDLMFSWDGTYKGKPVTNGVYVYQVRFKGRKSTRKQAAGTIYIHSPDEVNRK
jgi:gliding motility-associated-like protein